MDEIIESLSRFIDEQFDVGGDRDFTPEVNLFDYGFVDSLGATEILLFVEERWNIEITQKDLTLYPMNSVREIAEVVASKLKG